MFGFFNIFFKNVRLISKSKFSLLLILIGPLALISLFSFGIVGSGVSNVEISFYSEETGQIREVFLESLRSNSFIISDIPEVKSESESETIPSIRLGAKSEVMRKIDCINEVREGKTSACIMLEDNENGFPLPEDLTNRNIKNLKKGKGVNLYVDFSKQRIVWGIISKVQIVVDSMSDRIQQEIIEEISSKFDSSLNQINLLNSNLELLRNQISISQNKINQIQMNLENFRASSIDTIDSVITNLNSINNSPQGSVIPQIASSIVSLNNIKLQISSVVSNSNSLLSVQEGITQFKQSLDSVESQALAIQDQVSTLKNTFSKEAKINADKFIEPIPIIYSSIEEAQIQNREELNLADYLLPSIISFFLLFTSLTLGSTLTIRERSSSAHIRNYLSKTHKLHFVVGNLLYLLLIILIQISIILIFSNYLINPLVSDNWRLLIIYLVLGISAFSVLGMCIGYLFNSRDGAILTAVCISLIFIIFSPLINPIETMPQIFRDIFSNSPALLIENGISRAILFNRGINGDYFPIIQLFIFFLVGFFICLILHSMSKERLVKE